MNKYKNRENAWIHFWPEGDGKAKPGYHLHHIDQSLRHNDPERYNEWRPEDLIMVTNSEHTTIHNTGEVLSEETKQKIREKHLGTHHSEESKKKMSETRKGKPSTFKGRKHTEESKRKMSEKTSGEKNGFYGKHHSEESIQKMRDAKINISGENHPMFGKHHNEETRRKMSEAQTRRWLLRRGIK